VKRHLRADLEKFGLTNAEARCYLGLMELGETKTGPLIKHVPLSSSNVYEALRGLVEKGLVAFVIKNKIRYYKTAPPDSLSFVISKEKEELTLKEKQLTTLVPELNALERVEEQGLNAEVFVGFKGVQSALKALMQPVVKGEELVFFHKYKKETAEIVHKFFAKMDIENVYSHIATKGLFDPPNKQFMKRRKYSTVQAKYTTMPIPSDVDVYGDKVLIMSWSEHPVAFVITSEQTAQIFRDLFYEIWEKTK
tara:strand:+ start:1261 stop:2013 length:753 start_codon:yes stop_codon:yes gene_type:complete